MLDDEDIMVQGLYRVSKTLSNICNSKDEKDYFYDAITGSIIWNDELPLPKDRGKENFWGMRPVFRYRSSLIMGEPDTEWEEYWKLAISIFPNWIGFSNNRTSPSVELIQFLKIHGVK